ncbi:hypothetical protein JL37_02570 [Achromobacter sp. RTa]|uniref:acetyl-CoA carboxylase biotin carboxyl carrier protein n=1 Tax=Achromobacter sp. RTa TaxID=1532557 RepID=UPI00051063E3|nr:biotin/lipoyl-containing protein [Achromobacter sp. RTa]KGE00410.1 hypothetical protein JL37_02570 [Achromobacter sp. RTa]
MTQNTQLILDMIDLVAEERIAELYVSEPAFSVRIRRRAGSADPAAPAGMPASEPQAAATAPTSQTVAAPLAGAFYRASSPGGEPLAREGGWAAAGAPLCVIEAMKMLTEVTAPQTGTVVRVLCEDGQMVEQGQALFILEPGEADHVS